MLFLDKLSLQNICAIDVYLKKRKNRLFVGALELNKKTRNYEFTYADSYLRMRNIIPLGPELPLTEKHFVASELFQAFQDRIPERENAAYIDYCRAAGISVDETNSFILLATIGRQGPSSFVFEPKYGDDFSAQDLKKFREELGLTIREFAAIFDISTATITKFETGKNLGHDILRVIELFVNVPEAVLFKLAQNHIKIANSTKIKLLEKIIDWYCRKCSNIELTSIQRDAFNKTMESLKKLVEVVAIFMRIDVKQRRLG